MAKKTNSKKAAVKKSAPKKSSKKSKPALGKKLKQTITEQAAAALPGIIKGLGGILQNEEPLMPAPGHTKQVFIKSAKLADKDVMTVLNVKYHEQIILISGTKRKDIHSTINREGDNAIHEDLRSAFSQLNIHLGIMTEMLKAEKAAVRKYVRWKDLDMITGLKDFNVTGFTIGGSGDNEGITLIGTKRLSTGKYIHITTPFEKWSSDSDDAYKFMAELAEAIQDCRNEVMQYLDGKMAPSAQTEIDFDDETPAGEITEDTHPGETLVTAKGEEVQS